MQGKLARVIGSHPAHMEVIITITGLCSDGISELEAGLTSQMLSDIAAHEEEERAKAEAVRMAEEAARAAQEAAKLAVEQAEKDRMEKRRRMEQDRLDIEAAEREIAAKKRTWMEANNLSNGNNANNDSVEEEDAEEVNDSAADEVSPLCPCIVYNTHNFIQCLRGLERSPSATWNWTPATKLRRSNMM